MHGQQNMKINKIQFMTGARISSSSSSSSCSWRVRYVSCSL